MFNNPYYAPYQRPMGYYNPSIPSGQDASAYQPVQQPFQQGAMQTQAPIIPNTQPSNDGMLWVLNETEAMAYPVALNNNVTLWDKNEDTIYIKSVNAQGVPSMRILDYAERTADNAPKTVREGIKVSGGKFVSLEAFEALKGEFGALRGELDEIKARTKGKKAKAEDTIDE